MVGGGVEVGGREVVGTRDVVALGLGDSGESGCFTAPVATPTQQRLISTWSTELAEMIQMRCARDMPAFYEEDPGAPQHPGSSDSEGGLAQAGSRLHVQQEPAPGPRTSACADSPPSE